MRWLAAVLCVLLPLGDLTWNLTHLNIGLSDFYGLTLPALGLVQNQAWPATPYFPAGYPLLLVPFGLLGSTLIGGYLLTAVGGVLALDAVRRLSLDFQQSQWIALLAVLLAWLTASYRVVSGSPCVDMLFTGCGLFFIWASLREWTCQADRLSRYALIASAVALPLLRYHATVLVAPVLMVLLIKPAARRSALMALTALAAMVVFNYASWAIAYRGMMPSVVGIQVRNGVEADYLIHYPSHEALYADYVAYTRHARTSSLLEDYSAGVLLRHTLQGYYHFLRRPAVAFAILLGLIFLAVRKPLPDGSGLLILWAAAYSLALSPAYYTPRGALLPELALTPVVLLLISCLFGVKQLRLSLAVGACFFLAAQWRSAQFARAMWAENMHFAGISREVDQYRAAHGIPASALVASDARVLPLKGNPWCKPYLRTDVFWLDDPAIRAEQIPGAPRVPALALAQPGATQQAALMSMAPEHAANFQKVASSAMWKEAARFDEQVLFLRAE